VARLFVLEDADNRCYDNGFGIRASDVAEGGIEVGDILGQLRLQLAPAAVSSAAGQDMAALFSRFV
jgi:hypothetical protein